MKKVDIKYLYMINNKKARLVPLRQDRAFFLIQTAHSPNLTFGSMSSSLYVLRTAKCGIWLKCFFTLYLYCIFCPRCHFATTPGRNKTNIYNYKIYTYTYLDLHVHLLRSTHTLAYALVVGPYRL